MLDICPVQLMQSTLNSTLTTTVKIKSDYRSQEEKKPTKNRLFSSKVEKMLAAVILREENLDYLHLDLADLGYVVNLKCTSSPLAAQVGPVLQCVSWTPKARLGSCPLLDDELHPPGTPAARC